MTRQQIIKQYEQTNRKFEEKFFPSVRSAIHKKVSVIISRLREGGYDSARNYLLTDLTNPAMAEAIRKLYILVGRKHAQITYSRLLHDRRKRKYVGLMLQTKGFGFNQQWTDFIINFLSRFLLEKVTIEIANTTRDAMIRTLNEMVKEGLSVDLAIERLKDWPYERFQAARIVRTEVNRASNVGNKAQADTDGFQQWKEWVSAHDHRVRGVNPKDHASHIGLDGTKINEDDVFIDPRNGDHLQFPGDPKASAASTINCRCQVVYTYKRTPDGELIPKRKTTTVLYPRRKPQPLTITI